MMAEIIMYEYQDYCMIPLMNLTAISPMRRRTGPPMSGCACAVLTCGALSTRGRLFSSFIG
jgi:hypothetical protein